MTNNTPVLDHGNVMKLFDKHLDGFCSEMKRLIAVKGKGGHLSDAESAWLESAMKPFWDFLFKDLDDSQLDLGEVQNPIQR